MGFELPLCTIPEEIRENYEERVSSFYQLGRKEDIENSVIEIQREYGLKIKNLIWDEKRGLTNVTLNSSFGLDLREDNRRYAFHNLENMESKEAKFLFEIALSYVLELSRIEL
jgi:hypothetical protein